MRFATVMYGGVSLAIYINGVTQELLRLVRATASRLVCADELSPTAAILTPRNDSGDALLQGEQLDGTERIYRKIAQVLGPNSDWSPEALASIGPESPLQTRFIVDILSGTSAGGINAVFLAKALANGQSIGALSKLWIEDGAIENLLNDQTSGSDAIPKRELPASLLNSRRMYRELLEAFEEMDDIQERQTASAQALPTAPCLVREMDLFVTTTDIAGLPIALRLSDRIVSERRHRNVFQLRFSEGTDRNDFKRQKNPFLAFVARCTSAFPFAFEPMKLKDIDSVLANRGTRENAASVPDDGGIWRPYFPTYTGVHDAGADINAPGAFGAASAAEPWLRYGYKTLATRAFGDGGYLDNKPFEYAIEAVANRRRSGLFVNRKLLYLEPSPEHPERDSPSNETPNAIENVNAALSLARYETIRSDLQRVLSRNRLVERVNRIVSSLDEDIAIADVSTSNPNDARGPNDARDPNDYANSDLVGMIRDHGIAYGGYHRLKVSALTDEIAQYVSRLANYNENSDEFQAIRLIVSAWRKEYFAPYFQDAQFPTKREGQRAQRNTDLSLCDGEPGVVRSENIFLLRYDLSYRIRRLNFVLNQIERLQCLDEAARTLLAQNGFNVDLSKGDFSGPFLAQLKKLHAGLLPALITLQTQRNRLLSSELTANPMADKVQRLQVSQSDLLRILEPGSPERRAVEATKWIRIHNHRLALKELAQVLTASVAEATKPAASVCESWLPFPPISAPRRPDGTGVAQTVAGKYYHLYDRYDQVIFPAFFSTDVGDEAALIDVVRISPEDATSLVSEGLLGESRRKLAGVTLSNFGAFLDRHWRWNDIMWGRLDGSERLIRMLLPGDDKESGIARQQLIDEAHGAILEEEFDKADANIASWTTDADSAVLRKLLTLPKDPQNEALRCKLRLDFRQRFKARYRMNNNIASLSPAFVSSILARSTRVIGQMFTRMSEQYALLAHPAEILTRVGRIGWSLIEAATPQSISNLIVNHWIKLLYLFDALLIAASVVVQPIRNFSFQLLAVTALVQFTLYILRETLARRNSWWKRLMTAVIATAVVAIGLGITVAIDSKLRRALWTRAQTADGMYTLLWSLLIAAGLGALFIVGAYFEHRRALGKQVAANVDLALGRRHK